MPQYGGSFSGRPAYSLQMTVSVYSQDTAANTTRLNVRLYLSHDTSASSGTYDYVYAGWAWSAGSASASGSDQFLMGPSGDYVGKEITLYSRVTAPIAHNADGTKTVSIAASAGAWDPPGSASLSGSYALPTIPRAPGAPTLDSISSILAASAKANFTAPASIGGGAITGYTTRVSLDPAFGSGVTTFTGLTSPHSLTGLTPNSPYYAQTKATNAYGDSPWSATKSFTTAAAGAPHLGVARGRRNSGFWLFMSPPFTVGAVTTYTYQRVVTGPGAPAPVTTVTPDGTGTGIFDSLVLAPGQTVTYQALATIGGSPTGYSPSVSFDYAAEVGAAPGWPLVDGSLGAGIAPFDIETAHWHELVNNSISSVYGPAPTGWRTFARGAGALCKGAVTQIRTSVGLGAANTTGSYDVMAVFGSVQSAAGVRIGTDVVAPGLAQVYESVTYFASVLVAVDVATRLAVAVEWYDSTFALISTTVGVDQLLTANVPTTLSVSGSAPAGAVWAAVVSIDVAGTGWATGSLRFCGSAQLTASASYTYFDGDKAADPLYAYSWQGTANASSSVRTALVVDNASTALQDPDDDPIPAPPRAPVVEDSAVLSEIVWRRYITSINATNVREWIASVPTLILHANAAIEREVRIRYWRNPFAIPATSWTEEGAVVESEQVISYIPAYSTFTIDGVHRLATVVTDGGDTAGEVLPASHLLYGDGGGPATWPVLNCGMSYILTLDVPISSTIGNLDISLELTDRMF